MGKYWLAVGCGDPTMNLHASTVAVLFVEHRSQNAVYQAMATSLLHMVEMHFVHGIKIPDS